MMKKIILWVFLLAFVTSSYGNEKIIVLLDWFANPDHAPLFVAEQQGFFKQQGLDVELIGPADPTDPPKLVAAGKADIAITYQPQFLEQIDNGLPLVCIATLISKPLNCLVVLKESSIKKIGDLKGKNIGHSSGGMNQIMLKVMLEKNGLELKDVKNINIHYDLTQALLSGKVDAVTGMMRNFEVNQLALVGHPARVFYPEDNGIPNYAELILVANKNQAKADKLKRFLSALKLGVEYLRKHPGETWLAFAKAHPEVDNELNKRAWKETLAYFAEDPVALDKKEFLRFAHFMKDKKMISKVQPISSYANE